MNFFKHFILLYLVVILNSCGLYKKTDARKTSVNVNDRIQKNIEEGRGIRFGNNKKIVELLISPHPMSFGERL
jgi:hypothetical protein